MLERFEVIPAPLGPAPPTVAETADGVAPAVEMAVPRAAAAMAMARATPRAASAVALLRAEDVWRCAGSLAGAGITESNAARLLCPGGATVFETTASTP